MTDLQVLTDDEHSEITALAKRYRNASGLGMQVLNLIGGQAESLIDRLPDSAKARLEGATQSALIAANETASTSRRLVGDQSDWLNKAVTTAMGAAGGLGGLPTALAELPITTTVLLRAIQGVAAEHGFDPEDHEIKAACINVFASAGPLEEDDGSDLGFLTARVTITGGAVNKLIAAVAPKFAAVLGQKLAAQTIPVLGAVAGAATNYAFTSYYQEMAHVQFTLLRMERDRGLGRGALITALSDEMDRLKLPTRKA